MKFTVLAEAMAKLEETASRNDMVDILGEFFAKVKAGEVKEAVYLLQGQVAPPFEGIDFGLGDKLVMSALSLASGYSRKQIEAKYIKSGDLGKVAEAVLSGKKQMVLSKEELTVGKVFSSFKKLSTVSGTGSQDTKLKLLANLLTSATPLEARYLARIPLGKLRLGVGDPTILDALSKKEAGDKSLRDQIESAYNKCSDLGLVAETLFSKGAKGLSRFKIKVGSPVRPALCERLSSAEEIIEKIGKCAVEAKYDGFRAQVHKDGDKVEIFSRHLERMSHMFPDVVSAVRQQVKAKQAIFESEALAYNEKKKEFLPFQVTIQRKRKHGVAEAASEFPLKIFAFDLIYADGKDWTGKPYGERREALEEMIGKGKTIVTSDQIVTDEPDRIDSYFSEALDRGLEGIVAKDLKASYTAGKRKFAWIKLKKSYKGELADTLDVVIVGYYHGRGKRTQFGLGGLLAAVYDDHSDKFKTIAKVGSGLTEEGMSKLKTLLDEIKRKSKPARLDASIDCDVWVEPKYVIEVTADEITKSPLHTAGGFALRFPRMVGWIRDKKPEDATTVDEVEQIFKMQKHTKVEK